MSNNASISAAKRRRGGGPPPPSPLMSNPSGQGGGGNVPPGMPPGLPPNFRQLPPQVQQQMLRQLQQRGPPTPNVPPPKSTSVHVNKSMPVAPNAMGGGGGGGGGASNGPYSVNSVLHNRATVEVSGLHIRDLPMTSTGLPCLPSGAPLPPNVLFKLHHDELLNQDATLNEHSNRLQMLMNRVDRIDKEGGSGGGGGGGGGDMMMSNTDTAYENIIEDSNFISKVVDNILTNTNLSDIINQIEPLQKENEALRALLNSQQKTLNELSGLVMKLLANRMQDCTSTMNENSEYLTYDANNMDTYTDVSHVTNTGNTTYEVIDTTDTTHDLGGDDGDDGDDGGDDVNGINEPSKVDNSGDGTES